PLTHGSAPAPWRAQRLWTRSRRRTRPRTGKPCGGRARARSASPGPTRAWSGWGTSCAGSRAPPARSSVLRELPPPGGVGQARALVLQQAVDHLGRGGDGGGQALAARGDRLGVGGGRIAGLHERAHQAGEARSGQPRALALDREARSLGARELAAQVLDALGRRLGAERAGDRRQAEPDPARMLGRAAERPPPSARALAHGEVHRLNPPAAAMAARRSALRRRFCSAACSAAASWAAVRSTRTIGFGDGRLGRADSAANTGPDDSPPA